MKYKLPIALIITGLFTGGATYLYSGVGLLSVVVGGTISFTGQAMLISRSMSSYSEAMWTGEEHDFRTPNTNHQASVTNISVDR